MYDSERDEIYEEDVEHITGWCADCGVECESITIDEGIGSYEYWGSKGTHHAYCEASPCCNAEVLENEPELEE